VRLQHHIVEREEARIDVRLGRKHVERGTGDRSGSGHGFTPVAVCFNCWINRRASARIYNSGEIVRFE
jgi:hypothetical protein